MTRAARLTPSHALVRPPGESFARAVRSHAVAVDVAEARAQHAIYCQALQAAGLSVEALEPDEAHPDSCFVQDPALVIEDRAIIGQLAVPSRRGEEADLARWLEGRFSLERIVVPGTLEGGDVLRLPERVVVGRSARTNPDGIDQLASILAPLGLPVTSVPVSGYLHLLSAATYLGQDILLCVGDVAQHDAFAGLDLIVLPPDEAYAANALAVGHHVIVPDGYPRTARALRARGFAVLPVPMSQFAAADGGVTCLSLAW